MGGICGFVGIGDKPLLKKMSQSLRHRGPSERAFIDKNVSLASRGFGEDELAKNEDESIWVAFDGEIFNGTNLQDSLRSEGHKFSSLCNSELIPHLYEAYDDSFVNELRGSFALALWDSRKKSLILARDRDGERSIFHSFSNGILFFASEIKALLCCESIERKLNFRGLDYFFSWGHVPAPETLFNGIRKLPPSHFLTYKDNRINLHRYWSLDFSKIEFGVDEDEWCKRIYDMLIDSVRVRLTRGPLGILLGGLDSNTMASLMKRLTDEPLKSFTINFENEEFNEPYAKSVADWLGIENYQQTLCAKDFVRVIPELVCLFDDPKVDLLITIPTFLAIEMAKEYVRTIFTADGADSVFWSWGWTSRKSWASHVASRLLPKDRKAVAKPKFRSRKRYSMSISGTRNPVLLVLHSLNDATKARILNAGLPPDLRLLYDAQYYHEDELQELFGRHTLINVCSPFLECVEYPVDDLGSKINRMRLTNKQFEVIGGWGLERLGDICSHFRLGLRTPFEDYQLKEMAAKIPPLLKQPNELADKYIFRRAVLKYSLLPKEVVKQRKWGFGWGLPGLVSSWFKDELKDYVEQTIMEGAGRVKPFLREKALMKYLRNGNAIQILSLLMFILWYERFF